MGIVKAHCGKCGKWFALEIGGESGNDGQVINFMDLTEEQAKGTSTTQKGCSFKVGANLRPCLVCGKRTVGRCSHIENLGRCGLAYSYQCLFCNQLKINLNKASSRYTEWAGTNLIPGVDADQYGNARGSQYDLARDGSYEGFKVVILCLYTGEGILNGIQQPVSAMKRKGFSVVLRTDASPEELRNLLRDACQLWVVSDMTRHMNAEHLQIIRNFFESGHGIYLFGDNEPYYADANYLGEALLGSSMDGNTMGDRVISVQEGPNLPGIIRGHPVSTGIVNFYEGITIAKVHTTSTVRPLVISSSGDVVTGIWEYDGRRAIIDGGFTRLYHKWNTAGTDRFIVNAAAWLANAENGVGGEIPFT